MKFYLRVRNLIEEQKGAALAEYGLLIALIAVVCILAVTALGAGVQGALSDAAGAL
ncbi:MAG: Flp family type IVb pilin [Chloroflexi bacterium]|nr:Flp family type IVb pilin [Chloroflexota bacterium]